jgi:hypothetical protein
LGRAEQISLTSIASCEAVARRSIRRLSQIAKGRKTRCSKHAHARIAKGGGFIPFFRHLTLGLSENSRVHQVSIEPEPIPQPGVAARALDSATDMSRSIGEVTGALRAAVDRLTEAIENARRPGQPLATLAAVTREAPLASLFVAFLFGIAVARRR